MSGSASVLNRLLLTWCPCADYDEFRLERAALEIDAAAFGAIRRAVAVARNADAAHKTYNDEYGASFTSEHARIAYEIRTAIRAAIGSDKT